MRITLFVLALVVVHMLGARGVLLVVLAAVISMALSFVMLGGMRDDVVAKLQERQTRKRQAGVDESAEDSVLG